MSVEISMREFLRQMLRRKWMIIATTIAFFGLALLIVLTIVPVYESEAKLSIGYFMEVGDLNIRKIPFEAEDDIQKRIQSSFVPAVTTNALGNGIIILKGRGSSAEEAQRNVMCVAEGILHQHDSMYRELKKYQDLQLRTLHERIAMLKKAIASVDNIYKKQANDSSLQGTMAFIERMKMEDQMFNLMQAIRNREVFVQSKPTQFISQPTSARMVRPKTFHYLRLSVLMGLAVGIISAAMFSIYDLTNKKVSEKSHL